MNEGPSINGVWAIVVTYNRLELLKDCIRALRAQSLRPDRILVVNNGSSDGTQEWLDVQADLLVIQQTNSGSSGGFYSGMRYAYEHGAQYFWLMDDDTLPNEIALEELINAVRVVGLFSFVCSRVVGLDGRSMHVPPLDTTGWVSFLSNGIVRVSSASFVSILVSRITVQIVGYPIREFFIWKDDVEFTSRCLHFAAGYIATRSIVKHLTAGTYNIWTELSHNREQLMWYHYRNSVYLLRKRRLFVLHVIRHCTRLFGATMLWIFRRKRISPVWTIFGGTFAGFFFNPRIDVPASHDPISTA